MNPFTQQHRALPNNVQEKIEDDYWLQDKGPTEIGKELKLDSPFRVLLTTSFAKDMLRQEREEIKYTLHKLMMLSTTQSTASKHSNNMLVGICKKCFCFELLSCLFYNKGRNCLHLLCLAVPTKNGPLTVILSLL